MAAMEVVLESGAGVTGGCESLVKVLRTELRFPEEEQKCS